MLFLLQNKLIKKRSTAFQAFLVLFVFTVMSESFIMGNVAYAQTSTSQIPAQNSAQIPAQGFVQIPAQGSVQISTQIPAQIPSKTVSTQATLPAGQVTQTVKNPINMTVSTTINNPPPLLVPQPVLARQYMPQRVMNSPYGQTPNTVSLEHNIYRDSVWNAHVPRKQIYEDPARKIHKSRKGSVSIVERNSASSSKKIAASISKNTKENVANVGRDGKTQAGSGNAVVLQPGSSATVSANSPEGEFYKEAQQGSMNASGANQGAINNSNLNNSTVDEPFVPNATLNSDIPQVKIPTPNTPPSASLSVEPRFGT